MGPAYHRRDRFTAAPAVTNASMEWKYRYVQRHLSDTLPRLSLAHFRSLTPAGRCAIRAIAMGARGSGKTSLCTAIAARTARMPNPNQSPTQRPFARVYRREIPVRELEHAGASRDYSLSIRDTAAFDLLARTRRTAVSPHLCF